VANGTATISASVGEKSAMTAVAVAQVVASLTVAPEQWNPAALGVQQQFNAVAHDANGHLVASWSVDWSTADSGIVVVNAAGMATATGVGASSISVVAGTVNDAAAVMVAQSVQEVRVAPATDTLRALNDTLRLHATALDGNQQPIAGASFTWHSSNPAILTVSNTGLVTAVAQGNATVTATAAGISGQAALAVTISSAPAVAAIRIAPEGGTATAAGAHHQFDQFATDASGHAVNAPGLIWSSSNPTVASVNSQGLVTAHTRGEVVLTATAAGKTSTANILVDASGAIANGVVWSVYFAQ
jgi:uncharacterized protein YjdB